MQMPCRTRAASATKSGKCLNLYCLRSYRRRSKQDPLTGASGKSWMAFFINGRMVVTGKTCPKTSPPTQPFNECATWTSKRTSEKKVKYSTLIIIDSQAVKNTCNVSVESKGFCKYKATNGAKSSGVS